MSTTPAPEPDPPPNPYAYLQTLFPLPLDQCLTSKLTKLVKKAKQGSPQDQAGGEAAWKYTEDEKMFNPWRSFILIFTCTRYLTLTLGT